MMKLDLYLKNKCRVKSNGATVNGSTERCLRSEDDRTRLEPQKQSLIH